MALVPAALIAAAGMALAIPAAYALSVFTPVGLARRAEISPGLSFDAPVLLGGALLLTRPADRAGRPDRPACGLDAGLTPRRGAGAAALPSRAGWPAAGSRPPP